MAGEYAGRRELLESVPFFTGYAVEIGLLIDVMDRVGLPGIGQVDLERGVHRNQSLIDLSRMSFVILKAAITKLEERQQIELLTEMGEQMGQIRVEGDRLSLEIREVGDVIRPPIDQHPCLPRPASGAPVMSPGLRVVVAPDSFGGALDSVAVAAAVARGWASARPDDEVIRIPMADGGEGTLARDRGALGTGVERRTVATFDPLGRDTTAEWLALDGGASAFVEMAAASLSHCARGADALQCARASTRAPAELIRSALDAGASAWSWASADRRRPMAERGSGGAGPTAARRERGPSRRGRRARGARPRRDPGLDPRLADVEVLIKFDVTSPLVGPRGAAATFSPQKGRGSRAVAELDAALGRWGPRSCGDRTRRVRGAGRPARGAPRPGSSASRPGRSGRGSRSWPTSGLGRGLRGADLVITGEGRANEQTLAGKAAMGVARHAGRAPVILLCGGLGPGAEIVESSGAFAVVQPIVDRPTDLGHGDGRHRAAAGQRERAPGAQHRHRPPAGHPCWR